MVLERVVGLEMRLVCGFEEGAVLRGLEIIINARVKILRGDLFETFPVEVLEVGGLPFQRELAFGHVELVLHPLLDVEA